MTWRAASGGDAVPYIALLPFDARVVRYALALALVGAAIAAYHTLLVWGLVPKDLVPCGTPEFFVNGKPLSQFGSEQLQALVKSETRLAYGQ